MKRNRTLTLIFCQFTSVEEVHFDKDVFLVPYYLGKALGCKVKICYAQTEVNKNLPAMHRGVVLQPIKLLGESGKFLYVLRLLKTFWETDVLMLFHYYRMVTPFMGVLYKFIHPKGKLYVKMDASIIALKGDNNYKNIFEKCMKELLHWMFAKLVTCITCETKASYEFIINSKSTWYKFRKDLFIMPNAIDNEKLDAIGIQPYQFERKKNQFITVGRIGSPEKNNEMLLRALKQVDMKNWTMKIVGPYDEKFAGTIRTFFVENPDKKDSTIFTGNISDKKQLFELYNESKVFVFTSITEGSAFVFVESNFFRDYILSTDVGSFQDITEDEKYGESVPQDDDKVLAMKMQAIIDGDKDVNVFPPEYKGLTWAEVIKPVVEKLKF